jgi:hypothetical protein
MLEYLYLARWDQAIRFLESGSPPIYLRLLALNAAFLALVVVRRASGAEPMSDGASFICQLLLLGANMVILFQTEVEAYLGFTNRF